MKRRALLLLLIAGVAGYAIAVALSRRDPASQWQYKLDRAAAVDTARRTALRDLGIDARGWFAETGIARDRAHSEYLLRYGQPEQWIPPVDTFVILHDPKGGESVGVRLDTDGTPTALVHRVADKTPAGDPLPAAAAAASLRSVAPQLDGYRLVASERQPDGAVRYRWERASARAGLTFTAECLVRGKRVLERWRSAAFSDVLLEKVQRPFALKAADIVKFVILTLIAIGLFIRAAIRREFPLRSAIVLGAVAFLLLVSTEANLSGITAGEFEKADRAQSATPLGLIAATKWNEVIGDLFVAIDLVIIWGAGAAARRRQQGTDAFEQLLRGRVRRHAGSIATAVAAGIAAGGVFSAVTALSSLVVPRFETASPVVLMSGTLAALGAFSEAKISLFLVFAFLAPLCYERIRSPRASRAAAIALGTLVYFAPDAPHLASSAALALIWTLIGEAIFRRLSLLAVFAASTASVLAGLATAALLQPSYSVRTAGTAMFVVLIATGAIAAFVALRAREEETQPLTAPSAPRADKATRERMTAEFELARQAQAKMLPRSMPEIPGFALSALCRPAQQVGGDLYDFVPLPDGRWLIAVADVSGKGVSAALFMTMTKGLLLGACEEHREPGAIADAINRELYAFRNRNVFVTMFVGVLDPAQRRLDWVRAGHNASLLQRSGGEGILLKPRGIGLGMSPAFARTIETATLTFEPGDTLFVYSDGVTEAMNEAAEEYGEARLSIAARRAASASGAEDVRDEVVRDVDAFVGNAAQWDDLTLMVVRAE